MDLTAGNAAGNRRGAKILDPRSSSCCQRSPLSLVSLVLHVLTVSRTFWDFGSLHQKHRVGGTPGCAGRDGSNGWRSPVPRGDNTGRRVCLPLPPTIALRDGSFPLLCIVTGSSLFWDFGSLYQRRCGVITSYALSRQPYFCPCRCGDFGFVSRHKPAEHRILDVSATSDAETSRITRCLGSRSFFFFSPETTFFECTSFLHGHALAPPRWRVVYYHKRSLSGVSWSDRGHHIPALPVMSSGRVSGLTWHARRRLMILRRQLNSKILINLNV